MTTTPARRLAAGAAAALLAVGLLMPAELPVEGQTTAALDAAVAADPTDPRLAQTGAETVLAGVLLVAALLATGVTLLVSRRPGGR